MQYEVIPIPGPMLDDGDHADPAANFPPGNVAALIQCAYQDVDRRGGQIVASHEMALNGPAPQQESTGEKAVDIQWLRGRFLFLVAAFPDESETCRGLKIQVVLPSARP